MLARKSVTLTVDDVSDRYIQAIKEKHGELTFNANHVKAVEVFGVPKGWKRVYHKMERMYSSPTNGEEVYGYAMRFERMDAL